MKKILRGLDMGYYDAFKEGLKLILCNLLSFVKKLYVIAFIYGSLMIIPLVVAVLILWGLSNIPGISSQVALLISKIIASAGQIIPLSIYLYSAENELKKTNEEAPELCFAFCAAVIAWIWSL